jgi:hypothetical protein
MSAALLIVVFVLVVAWWRRRLAGWSVIGGLCLGLLLAHTTIGDAMGHGVRAGGAAVANAAVAAWHGATTS